MDELRVSVCYALPEQQHLEELRLPVGSLLRDALRASSLQATWPELDLGQARTGIFGKLKTPDAPLHDGDRIEVYRPLRADPMESRRRRAVKKDGGR